MSNISILTASEPDTCIITTLFTTEIALITGITGTGVFIATLADIEYAPLESVVAVNFLVTSDIFAPAMGLLFEFDIVPFKAID
jgi:hypothetical protein